MAHPFYGDYKKANYQVNKSLDNYITQAARLMSNERTVRAQQKGAKERLAMELDSVEKRFNRTENRLDTALADAMKTAQVNRTVSLDSNSRANALHPLEMNAKRLANDYNEQTLEARVDIQKYNAGIKKFEHADAENKYWLAKEDELLNGFIGKEAALFNPEEGMFSKNPDGNLILNKDIQKLLTPLNAVQIQEKYAEYKSSLPPEMQDKVSFENFKANWAKMETDAQAAVNVAIADDLVDYRNANGLKVGEEWYALEEQYGDQPWFEDVRKNQELHNANTTYDPTNMKMDGNDWIGSSAGTEVEEKFSRRPNNIDALTLEKPISEMFSDMSGAHGTYRAEKALKNIANAWASTDEELDNSRLGTTNIGGESYFTYREDDTDMGMLGLDDHWIGRVGADGKVYWQTDGTWSAGWDWDDSYSVYTTSQMLRETEGAGNGSKSGKARDIKF